MVLAIRQARSNRGIGDESWGQRRAMTESASPIVVERIKMARACAIVGLDARVMQQMAEAGEIPGTIKIRGAWTFDLAKLRTWLADLEKQQCESRKKAAAAKPRRIRNGTATRSMGASGSRAGSGAGRYEQAMLSLLGQTSRRTSRR